MKQLVPILGLVAAAQFAATSANAAPINVTLDFIASGASVASGSFSYDSALTGLIGYADLSGFVLNIGASSYDLAFVNQSGGFSDYRYFGWNADSNSFVSGLISGFPQIISALRADFDSGLFIRQDSAYSVLRDYPGDEIFFDSLNITVARVPLPAALPLLAFAIAALGWAGTNGRRRTEALAAA